MGFRVDTGLTVLSQSSGGLAQRGGPPSRAASAVARRPLASRLRVRADLHQSRSLESRHDRVEVLVEEHKQIESVDSVVSAVVQVACTPMAPQTSRYPATKNGTGATRPRVAARE